MKNHKNYICFRMWYQPPWIMYTDVLNKLALLLEIINKINKEVAITNKYSEVN